MADLIINKFPGISQSPHLGIASMRGLNLVESPGAVTINRRLTDYSGGVVTGFMRWFVQDPTSRYIYGLDANGDVYRSTNQGATWTKFIDTTGNGAGLAYWKGYLAIATTTSLNMYDITGGTLYTGTGSLTSSAYHPIFHAQNDKLYIGNDRYVATLVENAGYTFDANNATTYTFTSNTITLPQTNKVKCLEELGTSLMIGTWKGTNLYDQKSSDIWVYNIPSTTLLNPIKVYENGINQMINVNQVIYVSAGIRGNIYATTGSSAQKFQSIPFDFTDTLGTWVNPEPGAIMHHAGKLYLGFSSGGGSVGPLGVYSIDLQTRDINLENIISTGNDGTTGTTMYVSALCSIGNEEFIVGWADGDSYGIDRTNTSGYRVTSYGAYFETQLFRVGSTLQDRAFQELEFYLAKPLASGQGVRISYRTNLSDNYTVIGTFDYSALPSITSHNTEALITGQMVQLKVELTTGNSTSGPELLEIRLR